MCGLAGFIDATVIEAGARESLGRMLAHIAHRGPDDSGMWLEGPVAIGHRRLSIVDISPLGHQPMMSSSGRYVIAFNGEIYNHRALRAQLEMRGAAFKGHSDTEVLLAMIEEQGIEQALRQSVGMFAVALWDRKRQQLQLARDRFGEKPLYYGWQRDAFVFASELKAITAFPSFERRVDIDSVAELMRFGYIPAPHSIYDGIHKLHPATILSIDFGSMAKEPAFSRATSQMRHQPFWRPEASLMAGIEHPFTGTYAQATSTLDILLRDAVKGQMQADVPLGAMLSGGVDSSVVVALMQQQTSIPVRTYCIGFETQALDEAPHAKAVAAHLGTLHTEMYVSSADARSVIPQLPTLYDEPFGDSSQIPTYLLAKLVRRDVTVALSGDGGDEVFCGYPKFLLGQHYANLRGRRARGAIVNSLPWKTLACLSAPLPKRISRRLTATRLRALHALLSAQTSRQLAEAAALVSLDDAVLVPNSRRRETVFTPARPANLEVEYLRLAMLLDQVSYLPDDILTKVDRATMAASLEGRAPLLDHRVAEFAASLPIQFLADAGATKRILRDVLYQYVPRPLVDRPKQGFGAPVSAWLRTDLYDWAADLIHGSKGAPLLNRKRCIALIAEHGRGVTDHSGVLWSVLSFLAWANEWL